MALEQYIEDIKEYEFLKPGEEEGLFRRVKEGDGKARERIITAYLPWVVKIAFRYRGSVSEDEIEDLVGAGNIGLVESVERFEPKIGVPFYVYSAYWIEKEIFEYFRNRSFIRLSSNQERLRAKVYSFVRKYRANGDADRFYKELSKVLVGQRGKRFSPEEIKEMIGLWNRLEVSSLNEFVDETSETELGVFLADGHGEIDCRGFESEDSMNYIRRKIDGLDVGVLDKLILRKRLFDGEKFRDIGIKMGFTGERARQRYERARAVLAKELEKDGLFLEAVFG